MYPWQPHLGLGHVQQTHRVAVAVEKSSDCVQSLVELPLYVRQLLEHLAGRPQQHLDSGVIEEEYNDPVVLLPLQSIEYTTELTCPLLVSQLCR